MYTIKNKLNSKVTIVLSSSLPLTTTHSTFLDPSLHLSTSPSYSTPTIRCLWRIAGVLQEDG